MMVVPLKAREMVMKGSVLDFLNALRNEKKNVREKERQKERETEQREEDSYRQRSYPLVHCFIKCPQ